MKPTLERLRPRLDDFAKTEEVRNLLAELGIDDTGVYMLLVDYDFCEEAIHYCSQGGLKSLTNREIIQLADLFKTHYLVDDRLEKLKWRTGLDLAAKVVTFLKPIPLPAPAKNEILDEAERYLKKWDPEYKKRKKCWKGIVN